MPYSPDNVGDLQMQIQSSLLAVENMKDKIQKDKIQEQSQEKITEEEEV